MEIILLISYRRQLQVNVFGSNVKYDPNISLCINSLILATIKHKDIIFRQILSRAAKLSRYPEKYEIGEICW